MPAKVIQNNGICQIEGCKNKTQENRRFCETHRMRYFRHKRYDKPTPIESLLNKIRVDSDGCWNYTLKTNDSGYGVVWVDGKRVRAHRLSYEHFVGQIPDGMFICHKCDNPSCVNPDHLYAGTQKDNIRDMFERGRDRYSRIRAAKENTD